jgi:hypothetical protein
MHHTGASPGTIPKSAYVCPGYDKNVISKRGAPPIDIDADEDANDEDDRKSRVRAHCDEARREGVPD